MEHLDGSRLRMDYAAVPRAAFHSAWFGIEVKFRYGSYSEFSDALRQAVDYRHSKVVDARSHIYLHTRPPFVFVWPDIRDTSSSYAASPYEKWAEGSERSHGKLKIGLIRERLTWDGASIIEFSLSGSPVWRSNEGLKNGLAFGSSQRIGAA